MIEQRVPKAWLITGCSSGLGQALALYALERGDRVAATARNPADLADLVNRFPENCRALALDVRDPNLAAQAVAEASSAFGKLDVLVNNAGSGLVGALEELSEEEIVQNMEVNFFGTMRVIRAALPILRAQRSGNIVNISAAAAISNYPGLSIYGAAKCAVEGLSEALAAELRPLSVRVTIVQPGPLRTNFIRSLDHARDRIADYDGTSGKFARLLDTTHGRQAGDPGKAAAAIAAAVDSSSPPLRLVLGKYAHEKSRRQIENATRELDKWEPVGLPVEFASEP